MIDNGFFTGENENIYQLHFESSTHNFGQIMDRSNRGVSDFYNEVLVNSEGVRNYFGDVLTKSNATCSCGRAFPVVKSLSGRTGDVIHTPSGREFGPTLLARIAKGAHNIMASQIIQDKIDHIIVSYVPSTSFTEQDLADFKTHMTCHFPDELKMDFRSVSILEKTSRGKMNFLISKI